MEQGAAMLSDPELEAAIARWYELGEAHREYDGLDRRVKAALKTALPAQPEARGIVGSWAVTITDRPVKAEAKPRPARVDRIVKIEPLGGGGGAAP
jgi:hypothetical protein